jgi:hypothetical protein
MRQLSLPPSPGTITCNRDKGVLQKPVMHETGGNAQQAAAETDVKRGPSEDDAQQGQQGTAERQRRREDTWSPVASASTERKSPAASAWCRARRSSSLSSARVPDLAPSATPIMSAHDLRAHRSSHIHLIPLLWEMHAAQEASCTIINVGLAAARLTIDA